MIDFRKINRKQMRQDNLSEIMSSLAFALVALVTSALIVAVLMAPEALARFVGAM